VDREVARVCLESARRRTGIASAGFVAVRQNDDDSLAMAIVESLGGFLNRK